MHFLFHCRFISILFLFLAFLNLPAQQIPDSIPQGIISVKRPPVTASYTYRLVYLSVEDQNPKHITEFSSKQIVFGDSGISSFAPQPIPSNMREEGGAPIKRDAESKVNLPSKEERLGGEFDWENFLKIIPWQFEFSDSIKLDSAQFEFVIDKKGNATCRSIPWTTSDSTGRAFEKTTFPYAFLLNQWYPARRTKSGLFHVTKKMKNIPCIVMLTIYAQDPNAGRFLPIESGINPK